MTSGPCHLAPLGVVLFAPPIELLRERTGGIAPRFAADRLHLDIELTNHETHEDDASTERFRVGLI